MTHGNTMESLQENERLRQAILAVIEQQIATATPPETGQTVERLIDSGFSREKAFQLVGYVVGHLVFDILNSGRTYNEAEYVRGLAQLPTLPWGKTETP